MSYSRFVYSKSELEELADSINRRFFSNRLIGVSPLDPYDLVEKIGCDVEWKYISPDESILGMTFFDDGMWYIWENGECVPGVLPQKEYGGTAAVIRFEKATGRNLGRNGKNHIQKGRDMLSYLNRIASSEKLSQSDRIIANKLISDLKTALGGK